MNYTANLDMTSMDALVSAPPKNQELLAQLACVSNDLAEILEEREKAYKMLERAHRQTLIRLTIAAEFRDDDTGVHLLRMGKLSGMLARLIGWEENDAQMLEDAAPMHDIGKIGIPDSVLKKAGSLTEEEWAIMRTHPSLGEKILGESGVPILDLAAEIAVAHHERYDGSGYPCGLQGSAIPISARIVALVDYFDALTMDRVYRKAFPDDEVFRMIEQQNGKHFDPELVQIFLDNFAKFTMLRDKVNAESNL